MLGCTHGPVTGERGRGDHRRRQQHAGGGAVGAEHATELVLLLLIRLLLLLLLGEVVVRGLRVLAKLVVLGRWRLR